MEILLLDQPLYSVALLLGMHSHKCLQTLKGSMSKSAWLTMEALPLHMLS